jgi:hypothetical protein
LVALGDELFLGFALGLVPGWANGWPGGLTISQVWPAGMTTILYIILITGAIVLGASLSFLLSRLEIARPYTGIVFLAWLVVGAILAVPACISFYQWIHAWALEVWPDGYNP